MSVIVNAHRNSTGVDLICASAGFSASDEKLFPMAFVGSLVGLVTSSNQTDKALGSALLNSASMFTGAYLKVALNELHSSKDNNTKPSIGKVAACASGILFVIPLVRSFLLKETAKPENVKGPAMPQGEKGLGELEAENQ